MAPQYNFKLGEIILYRCPKEVWRIALYGGVETHDSAGNLRDIIEVIPLEGNEHMHGTCNDVKPKRWRADISGEYFYINSTGLIGHCTDDYVEMDDVRYEVGNYFKTEQEAKETAQKIINLLKQK